MFLFQHNVLLQLQYFTKCLGKTTGVDKPTEDKGELVMVKELGGGRMRRSAQSSLPRYLHMQLTVAGETMTLQLQRNTDIDTNIPFTFAGNKSRKVYIPDRQVGNTLQANEMCRS